MIEFDDNSWVAYSNEYHSVKYNEELSESTLLLYKKAKALIKLIRAELE